jgi:hypothetical protein
MGLWWVPVGIAAWFVVSVVVALGIGHVLRHCSQVKKTIDRQWVKVPDPREPSWDERQVSPERTRAGIAKREQDVTL